MTGNPEMAYEAMSREPNIGVLMLLNVIVYQVDEGSSMVASMEPGVRWEIPCWNRWKHR